MSSDSLLRRIYYSRLRDVLRGRLDARLDWRQIVAAADLPAELANAVTQVVSKSRLWRSEKAAVAAELVAHFQDGLEASVSSEQLLTAFGDAQDAGQLIRRAKRRNRSAAWQLWHYGWMTAAGLLLVYVMAGVWMATSRPSVSVNYLEVLNKPALAAPENERAWPIYRDAFMSMGLNLTKTGTPAADFLTNDAPPGDPKWNEKEKFLNANLAAIAKLREAAARSHLGFVTTPVRSEVNEKDRELFGMVLTPEEIEADKHKTIEDRWVLSTLLPDLQLLRDAGRILEADAHRAAMAGDGGTAYADIIAILGVSRHAEEAPLLVAVAVADSIQSFGRNAVRDVLAEKPSLWSDVQLRDLAHQFAGAKIDWARGIEGERIGFYDSMQRLYTDNGNGDGRLALRISKDQNLFQLLASVNQAGGGPGDTVLANSGLALLTMPAANMVVASRKEMLETFENATNAAQARMSEPYWKVREQPLLETFLDKEQGPLGRFHYLFVRLMLPAYDNLLKRIVMSNSGTDGVYIGLALELYHRQHHKWPESLSELAPQWLPEVPVDRITGQPLHYKIVDDKPLVYSVGLDGDDDNGRAVPGEKGVWLPWTPLKKDPPEDGDWILWTTANSN
jgi:hypothetical protein